MHAPSPPPHRSPRHRRAGLARTPGLAGLALVVAGGMALVAVPATADPVSGIVAAPKSDGAIGPGLTGATKVVRYAGVAFTVPASWAVHDLAAAPRTCVRFDQHAVYLGTPGIDQNCPSHLVGRAESLLVQPSSSVPAERAPAAGTIGAAPAVGDPAEAAGQVATTLTTARLTVTAPYSADSRLAREIVASARQVGTLTAPRQATAAGTVTPLVVTARTTVTAKVSPTVATAANYATGSTATFYRGYGFDTCNAPSAAAMTAWKASPYRAIGVYIGGRNRACGWGNLSAAWVRAVAKAGWRLQPIYVGRQPSCTVQRGMDDISSSPAQAKAQGRDAGNDAVAQARLLGLAPGSVLYNDIENYNVKNATCSTATMTFLDAWTRTVHGLGYGSGVYSSAAGAITDMAKRYYSTTWAAPDVVWTARWDGVATTDEKALSSSQWANKQRIKQYRGDHYETWGGYRINIDSNYVNASVASPSYRYAVRSGGSVNLRSGPSTTFAKKGALAPGAPVDVVCQLTYTKVDGDPIWNKLTNGHYIADRFVSTPSATGFSKPLPNCSYAYQVEGNSLNTRAKPSATSTLRSHLPHGSTAAVVCQTSGTKVGGSKVWDRLKTGSYVSDIYLSTPGRPGYTSVIPRCQ